MPESQLRKSIPCSIDAALDVEKELVSYFCAACLYLFGDSYAASLIENDRPGHDGAGRSTAEPERAPAFLSPRLPDLSTAAGDARRVRPWLAQSSAGAAAPADRAAIWPNGRHHRNLHAGQPPAEPP